MDIQNLVLPKSSGIEGVKKEIANFIDYYRKAKGVTPNALHVSHASIEKIRKSLKAQKLEPKTLSYEGIPIEEKS